MANDFNNAIGPTAHNKSKQGKGTATVFVLSSMAAGLAGATQHFAHQFNYHHTLGAKLGYVYAPWEVVRWAYQWYDLYPEAFERAGGVGVSISAVGLMTFAATSQLRKNRAKVHDHLHGSARWATRKDIQKAGLLPRQKSLWQRYVRKPRRGGLGESVVVGAWKDEHGQTHYLYDSGPSHVLTYAPTRSGKGVGLVVPTLLTWTQSAVINDLKGELWALTAGWRKKHADNKVLRFEPASPTSIAWNPLDEIRLGPQEVGDVQDLATLIVDPDGKGLDTHWQHTAQSLLVGLILHALYKAKNEGYAASLPAVDGLMSDPDRGIAELWMEMTAYAHYGDKTHPIVARVGRDMMDTPEEELGSIVSTTKTYLKLFRDPIVAENVSRSDFRVKDLMHDTQAISLYIVTSPTAKARMRPLVRILLNMIVRLLADKISFKKGMPAPEYRHRLLMLLDEFPSLGKLGIMEESLAFIAGYGIKAYLICQDLAQLRSKDIGYGPDETITSNCHIQNAYPPGRLETANHLSSMTGTTTVAQETINESGKKLGTLGNITKGMQSVSRPLMTPDEILRMQGPDKDAAGQILVPGEMLIFVQGRPAIKGVQPLYFKDAVWSTRAAVEAPVESDIARRRPPAQAEIRL
jgi:type IV secretion system protein VirD4